MGVVEGEIPVTPVPTDEKLRNIARMESAELALPWPSMSFPGLLASSPEAVTNLCPKARVYERCLLCYLW